MRRSLQLAILLIHLKSLYSYGCIDNSIASHFNLNSTFAQSSATSVSVTSLNSPFDSSQTNDFALTYQRRKDDGKLAIFIQRYILSFTSVNENVTNNLPGSVQTVGHEILVNRNPLFDQTDPSIASLGKTIPGYIVVYQSTIVTTSGSTAQRVLFQRLMKDGTPLSTEKDASIDAKSIDRQDTSGTVASLQTSVLYNTREGFVIGWIRYLVNPITGSLKPSIVMCKIFNSDGSARTLEFIVSDTLTGASALDVASLVDGRFIVVWATSPNTCSGSIVFAQIFTPKGEKIGTEFIVQFAPTSNNQQSPNVVGLRDGGFVVTYTVFDNSGNSLGIFMQRFDALGARSGPLIIAQTSILSNPNSAVLSATNNGGWAITWNGISDTSGEYTIFAAVYAANGSAITNSIIVPLNSRVQDAVPAISNLGYNNFVIAWTKANQLVYGAVFGCSRDCVLGDFSDWSDCYPQCGVGKSKRVKIVAASPLIGGKECPQQQIQVRNCWSNCSNSSIHNVSIGTLTTTLFALPTFTEFNVPSSLPTFEPTILTQIATTTSDDLGIVTNAGETIGSIETVTPTSTADYCEPATLTVVSYVFSNGFNIGEEPTQTYPGRLLPGQQATITANPMHRRTVLIDATVTSTATLLG